MLRFINWWFTETWKLPHGFVVLLLYLGLSRAILMKCIDIDYMILDGIVFSILMSITMVVPEIRRMYSEE